MCDCIFLVCLLLNIVTGFDHPSLNMLIMASDVQEQVQQYVGRVLRKDDVKAIVIDIVDDFFVLQKHHKERVALYKRLGATTNNLFKAEPTLQNILNLNLQS